MESLPLVSEFSFYGSHVSKGKEGDKEGASLAFASLESVRWEPLWEISLGEIMEQNNAPMLSQLHGFGIVPAGETDRRGSSFCTSFAMPLLRHRIRIKKAKTAALLQRTRQVRAVSLNPWRITASIIRRLAPTPETMNWSAAARLVARDDGSVVFV